MSRPSGEQGSSLPDWGRRLAQILCVLFALLGATPLACELLFRSEPVQKWAAEKTTRALREQLGLSASYEVRISLLPLRLKLENLVVPANDGGSPVLRARRLSVTPKIFSLLSGRFDAGDIAIDEPTVRAVVRNKQLANLSYHLPSTKKSDSAPLKRAPFASLALSDGRISVDFGSWQVRTESADIDVFATGGPALEIAVRTTTSHVSHQRPRLTPEPTLGREALAYDDDVVCQLDLRAEIRPDRVLIRRFELQALTDSDDAPNTEPRCDAKRASEEPGRISIKLSQTEYSHFGNDQFRVFGTVQARTPVNIAKRYVRLPRAGGWVSILGLVRYESGSRLPDFKGVFEGGQLDYGPARAAERIHAEIDLREDVIHIPRTEVTWGNGESILTNARIAPFEEHVPLSVELLDGKGMNFPGLMRDIGVTPNTIVHWDLTHTRVANIRATLSPFKLHGNLSANTHNFEVFDRAVHDPKRAHMIGIKAADIRSNLSVDLESFDLQNVNARFGKSVLNAKLVSIGYSSTLGIQMADDTLISLEDISPITSIPIAGKARVQVSLAGDPQRVPILGTLAVNSFSFGGFDFGDILESDVRFLPLKVDFSKLKGKKGNSSFYIPSARLDFDSQATLVADATLSTQALNIRDFFTMFHFDQDPRFDAVSGTASFDGKLHYVLGGPEDRCGGGRLIVEGATEIAKANLFEEHFSGGAANFRYEWFDPDAGHLGANLDVPSFLLKKGTGTLLGDLRMRQGATLEGSVVGTKIPLAQIDAMKSLARLALGHVEGVGKISGSLDELNFDSTVSVSQVALGTKTLPASAFSVRLRSTPSRAQQIGKSRCGNPITSPFSESERAEDKPTGTINIAGQLFGGQITFDGLKLRRQQAMTVSGALLLKRMDLAPWAELSPTVGKSAAVEGNLSARIDLKDFSPKNLALSKASIALEELKLRQGPFAVELVSSSGPLEFDRGKLKITPLAAHVSSVSGANGVLDVSGSVSALDANPVVDLAVRLRPTELHALAALLPQAESVQGTLGGSVRLFGPWQSLAYQGNLEVKNGSLSLGGLPTPISDVNLELTVKPDEVRVVRGEAKLGGGSLVLSGGSEIISGSLKHGRLDVKANNVSLPLQPGVRGTFDAALGVDFDGDTFDEGKALPKIVGTVDLASFEYTRAVSMTADIESLTQRSNRTEFDAYDPADDLLELDILVRAKAPIALRNNLIDAQVLVDPGGLNLTGTNQRFGMRGGLTLKPGGRILLRRNEFEIRQGSVRFDNPTRILPQVDVTAVTDYRRYAEETTPAQKEAGPDAGASTQEGRWAIALHAHGDAERLKIDLSSEPVLSQDDIFLLLTVGLTRAELDQARSASIGEGMALEALGSITGADQAVVDAVPVVDEFRFGSAYSSRTGRTEPTVTIGKRLAQRIRANVTSGLSESREVRSNVEWKVSPQVSLEGSYDNVNDISSSSLGNLGADIRWRLEFQ